MPLSKISRLYPLLFAAFPVLSLIYANPSEIALADAIRPLLLALAFAAVITGVCSIVQKDPSRASLLAAGTIIAFFSYGHLYTLLGDVSIAGVSLEQHRYSLIFAGGTWLLWVLWTGNWLKDPTPLDRLFHGGSVIVVALPLAGILLQGLPSASQAETADDEIFIGASQDLAFEELPDIYYIVLDGYGRSDVLDSLYDFDNTPMLDHLTERGFYVADGSVSNYNQTVLSLAASLNMDYVESLITTDTTNQNARSTLADHLKHSRVRNYLSGIGYELIAFETGYSQTEIRDADTFLSPGTDSSVLDHPLLEGNITPIENMLLSSTGLRLALDSDALRQRMLQSAVIDPSYQSHRARIRYTLDALGKAAEQPGPTFAFAHIISPHPPFVFGSDGESVSNSGTYSLADADAFGGSPAEYIASYRDQIQHVNTLVSEAIDEILERSERSPLILLQSDHGPGAYMVWNSAEESEILERMGILSAYYFPDGQYQGLYPNISPINSFRVLFSTYFDAQLPLLPDMSYFSSWEQPLELIDVTEELR